MFASQVEKDMCAPAGVQMTLAVLGLLDTSADPQVAMHRRVREWESWRDSHNGEWGPTAIAKALAADGAPGYKVRVYETRADALFDAAIAIETTGKPVVLLTWRGAHTWVMTGYRVTADGRTVASIEDSDFHLAKELLRVDLPLGTYLVTTHVRPCAAACPALDGPTDGCEVQVEVTSGARVQVLIERVVGRACRASIIDA